MAEEKLRERDMLDRLAARYGKLYSNGPWSGLRHVGARHVRLHPGFGPQRIADYLAVDTWRSSGYAIHGHEVKVSRSDWLAELADPGKAEAIARYCTYWWLVVSDRSIVRDDLPDGWGLMVARGAGLAAIVQPRKRTPEPAPPHLVASFARAIAHADLRSAPGGDR